MYLFFFFFNDTATTEIYTLSLHDALPILPAERQDGNLGRRTGGGATRTPYLGRRPAVRRHESSTEKVPERKRPRDRKSTRLNSSHANISYAVFCLKKKKNIPYWKIQSHNS